MNPTPTTKREIQSLCVLIIVMARQGRISRSLAQWSSGECMTMQHELTMRSVAHQPIERVLRARVEVE